MKSPLELYEETAKEFNLTQDKQLNIRQKIAYASEQANQQRMIANRLAVDLAKAKHDHSLAKDNISKQAYSKKVGDFTGDLQQMIGNLDFFMELEKELNKANPDVKVSTADIPEG